MHIENIRAAEEILAAKIKAEFEQGIECVDVCEMAQATDMLKDLCAAEYHSRITVAMQESDEGTEESRRYYDNYRYADGRFAPKGHGTRRGYEEPPYYHMTPEDYHEWERNRDMDKYKGKLYFSEPITHEGMNHTETVKESRYDAKKRAYTESKEVHKANTPEDKQARLKSLEEFLTVISDAILEYAPDMGAEEKTLTKNKLSVTATKL